MNIKKILTALGMIGLLTAGAVRAQAPEAAQVKQDSLIAVDTVQKDGIRFIQSRDFEIYRGWTTGAAFNLSYADRPGDTTPYRLNITFAEGQFTMAAGQTKLLLKLKKAKIVMELINTKNIGPSDYRSELTKDGTYYYITPSFAISETQIRQIAADKVIKMRLIHDKGKFDREIQNNAAATGFKAAYEAILQRLASETVAEPVAPSIEAKPVEEETYGYIVDEEQDGNGAAGEEVSPTEGTDAETIGGTPEETPEAGVTDGETMETGESLKETVVGTTMAQEETAEVTTTETAIENGSGGETETAGDTAEETTAASEVVTDVPAEEAAEAETATETDDAATVGETSPESEVVTENTVETETETVPAETATEN